MPGWRLTGSIHGTTSPARHESKVRSQFEPTRPQIHARSPQYILSFSLGPTGGYCHGLNRWSGGSQRDITLPFFPFLHHSSTRGSEYSYDHDPMDCLYDMLNTVDTVL